MIGRLGFIMLFLVWISTACNGSAKPKGNDLTYSIFYENKDTSEKWATYLYSHLEKRAPNGKVFFNKTQEKSLAIYLSVDPNNEHDYCIARTKEQVKIIAKNDRVMLWLVYQIIANISIEDLGVEAKDIPPPVIALETSCKNFDFEYREPYFLPNLQFESAPIIGADMLETAWGIWGHGLSKVVEDEHDSLVYSQLKGKINKEQFCFSSLALYRATQSYIVDNFGKGDDQSYKFMIMPNDNDIVCTCDKCSRIGNTSTNAMPALSAFIMKLAQYFPKHSFYTTAYRTVDTPPLKTWPSNTGVMISTIELPKGQELKPSKSLDKFTLSLDEWQKKVPHVYIWDYAANFDDFLTPLPILYALQSQLRFFKEHKIEGVFLNGSGYDYSPFDDVKTYVSAALMMDVEAPIEKLSKHYFTHFYPIAGEYLSDYYLFLEQRFSNRAAGYGLYSSFESSIVAANTKRFVDFYDGLDSLIAKSKGEEKQKLIQLQTALSFTRLRLASTQNGSVYGFGELDNNTMKPRPEIKLYIDRLKKHKDFKNLANYKETDGALDPFIKDYQEKYDNPLKNLLIGASLFSLSQLDEDYNNIEIISDGLLGYPSDYHQGWLLVSAASCSLEIKVNSNVKQGKKIGFRFLNDIKHRITPPQKVTIYKDNKFYIELHPHLDSQTSIVESSTAIDISDVKSLTIEFTKQSVRGCSMAFDEIIIN